MVWAQTDTALLVLTLVIVAEGIASSFSFSSDMPATKQSACQRAVAANIAKLPELLRKS